MKLVKITPFLFISFLSINIFSKQLIAEDNSVKIIDCNEETVAEAFGEIKAVKVIGIEGNKDIELLMPTKSLAPNILTDEYAIFNNISSGTWSLCLPNLTYSKVKIISVDESLATSGMSSATKYSIAGLLVGGGVLVGTNLDDSNDNDEKRDESSNLGSSDNDVANETESSQSTINDSSDTTTLLPDDSCSGSKSSLRVNRNGGCGDIPDSLPSSSFN